MVKVLIDKEMFGRRAFSELVIKLGGREQAMGALVFAWLLGQQFWILKQEYIPMEVWKKEGLRSEIIEVGLARESEEGVYLCGARDFFEKCIQPEREIKPKAKKKTAEPGFQETWAAYSAAYESRYKVQPLRNTKAFTQINQFVKTVGISEAPKVAAFYLTHSDYFFTRNSHSVGIMLTHAQRLRTEMLNGKQTTMASASQLDKKATRFNVFNALLAEAKT